MMATRTCSGTVSASQIRGGGGRLACERDLELGEFLSLANDHATTVYETARAVQWRSNVLAWSRLIMGNSG
jgi:hypothetical protein